MVSRARGPRPLLTGGRGPARVPLLGLPRLTVHRAREAVTRQNRPQMLLTWFEVCSLRPVGQQQSASMRITLWGQGGPEPFTVSVRRLRLLCPSECSAFSLPTANGVYRPQSGGTVFAPLPWGANTEAPAHPARTGRNPVRCGLHSTLVRTSQEGLYLPVTPITGRRPEAREPAPLGAPSHPADDRRGST